MDETIRIALIRIGGIGDAVQLAGIARAVKRKYPNSHTTLFIRDKLCYEAIYLNPAVDQVVQVGNAVWKDITTKVLSKDYHIVFDNRYVTRAYYKPGFMDADRVKCEEAFKPYMELYRDWMATAGKISQATPLSSQQLSLQSACLEGTDDDLYMHLERTDYNMVPLLSGTKYVTIHNGADIARQTKCWNTKGWAEVAKYVKTGSKGIGLPGDEIKVIQLGKPQEDAIDGTIDMRGRTTLAQAAALIRHAEYHLDTEGGLVHIARAVKTRSVVLFGPTPVHFFGYEDNVNVVTPQECKSCFWTTDLWWHDCPKKYPSAKCMDTITPEMVITGINQIRTMPKMETKPDLNDINEQFALELPLTEGHYKGEKHQWDRIYAMMAKARGKDVLEVGAGDGYCVQVLKKQGYNVTATEVSQIRLKRMKESGIEAVYADVNKLPFPDASFDTVMCGEVLEHLDSMGQGLKELERVCRPNGIIIISLPTGPEYRPIKMHKWGIDQHSILKDGKVDMLVMTLERINQGGGK